jgi:hypothetical protein
VISIRKGNQAVSSYAEPQPKIFNRKGAKSIKKHFFNFASLASLRLKRNFYFSILQKTLLKKHSFAGL